MKRRFWEEDEHIYGGLTYTNQPNAMIGYPMWDYFSKGKGVLLGAYLIGAGAFVAAAKSPEDRIKDALEYGEKIHPGKYKANFECGVAVAWHRVPWTLGCAGQWTEEGRAAALQQSLRARRPHRAGGRACLAPAGVAGRRCDVCDRCDHPAASEA